MDENVETAESLTCFDEKPVQIIQIAYIRLDHQGAPAQFPDLCGGLLGRGAITEEVDHHICAVAGQVQGDGAPYAASRAGDEGSFAGEGESSVHVTSFFEIMIRRLSTNNTKEPSATGMIKSYLRSY